MSIHAFHLKRKPQTLNPLNLKKRKRKEKLRIQAGKEKKVLIDACLVVVVSFMITHFLDSKVWAFFFPTLTIGHYLSETVTYGVN